LLSGIYKLMEKIILRKARSEDLDSMWNNIWQDKELAKYMLWKPVENIEEAKIRLQKTIEYQVSGVEQHFVICYYYNNAIGEKNEKKIKR